MSEKVSWQTHIIELLIVTSGILIAFGLNSWNELRREEELANLYLEGIFEEMRENRTELQQKAEYHQELLDKLRETPLKTVLRLRPAMVKNAAWKLSENDIFKRYVDRKLYQKINQTYQIHDFLTTHAKESSSMMSEINVLGPLYLSNITTKDIGEAEYQDLLVNIKEGWIPIFEDWVGLENAYIEKIDEVLKDLENN